MPSEEEAPFQSVGENRKSNCDSCQKGGGWGSSLETRGHTDPCQPQQQPPMDPLEIFQIITIRLIFVDFFLIVYMWLYGYLLGTDAADLSYADISFCYVFVMIFNLIVAVISRTIPGRKRKGCIFQAVEVFHYFVLFLRVCAVPAFSLPEYFEISLISIASLVAQCFIALHTGNEFIQDPPTRSNSSLNINLEDSSWDVEEREEIVRDKLEEKFDQKFGCTVRGGTSI